MNVHELLSSLQTKIRAAEWAAGVPVFAPDSVVISAYVALESLAGGRDPWCFLTPAAARSDQEQPDLIEQDIQIQIVATNSYDGRGEAALMGANQESATKSHGKGLLELEEKVHDAIKLLTAADGVTVVFIAAGAAQAKMVPDGGAYFVSRAYQFRAFISTVADA